jgi:hypothetical protein
MSFYKVVKDRLVVGVGTHDDFRRYQTKHRIIIVSDPDRVEAIDCGGTLYHDTWMATPCFPCEPATVIGIIEDEYNELKAQLDAGKILDDGSLEEEEPVVVEEPAEEGGEEVRKTTAQILQEQIDIVDSQVKLAARFASV